MALRRRRSVPWLLVLGAGLSLLVGLAWLASTIWLIAYGTETYDIDNTGKITRVLWICSLLNHRLIVKSMTDSGTLQAYGITEQQFWRSRNAQHGRWTFRRQVEYVDYGHTGKVSLETSWWKRIKPLLTTREVFTPGAGCTSVWRRHELRLWWPFLLCATPTTAYWLWCKRRKRKNHCRQCGYNLTGNMSGICPECGTPIPEEVKIALGKQAEGDEQRTRPIPLRAGPGTVQNVDRVPDRPEEGVDKEELDD
jgi:hypothetical protein